MPWLLYPWESILVPIEREAEWAGMDILEKRKTPCPYKELKQILSLSSL